MSSFNPFFKIVKRAEDGSDVRIRTRSYSTLSGYNHYIAVQCSPGSAYLPVPTSRTTKKPSSPSVYAHVDKVILAMTSAGYCYSGFHSVKAFITELVQYTVDIKAKKNDMEQMNKQRTAGNLERMAAARVASSAMLIASNAKERVDTLGWRFGDDNSESDDELCKESPAMQLQAFPALQQPSLLPKARKNYNFYDRLSSLKPPNVLKINKKA